MKKASAQPAAATPVDENATVEGTWRKQIEECANGTGPAEVHLSCSLGNYDRLNAHLYAKELGLVSESIGKGPDRHIRVVRTGAPTLRSLAMLATKHAGLCEVGSGLL